MVEVVTLVRRDSYFYVSTVVLEEQQVCNCETNDHWAGADLSVLQLGALYFLIVFSRFIFNIKSTLYFLMNSNKAKLG